MCVILFALNTRPDMPLLLIANRDEYYARPTIPAAYWDDLSSVYGGRDLQRGGTWLGITDAGRFAAVTNYRDPSAPSGINSRGELVTGFLISDLSAQKYLEKVYSSSGEYSGFNLLVGEFNNGRTEIFYYSNRGDAPQELEPGIYGLSNHLLDTPWPKVVNGKARFAEILASGETGNEKLFDLLQDRSLASDVELPKTGIPYKAEKALSAIFIETPDYGTRCSTVLRIDRDSKWRFEERVFV